MAAGRDEIGKMIASSPGLVGPGDAGDVETERFGAFLESILWRGHGVSLALPGRHGLSFHCLIIRQG